MDDSSVSSATQEPCSPSQPTQTNRLTTAPTTTPTIVTVESSIAAITELIDDMTGVEMPVQSTQETTLQDVAMQQVIQTKPSSYRHRFSIYRRNGTPISKNQLTLFKTFAQSIKTADHQAQILPIRNDKHMLSLTTTDQINNVDNTSIRNFFKPYKRTTKTLSGDFHVGTKLSFEDFKAHISISNWFELNGYNVTFCECQTSDMVKIGFLGRVRGFTYRDDISTFIINHPLWVQDPFHFRLYFDTFVTKEKGKMTYVLMVDVERPNVDKGISFFESLFDGLQKNSPNAIAYPFFTLYKNTYSEVERAGIISDTDSHTDNISVVTLHGLQEIDAQITLRNNITVPLRHLLLSLPCPGTSNGKMFLQVERQSGNDWLLCAFSSTDSSRVMARLPSLAETIQRYVLVEDLDKLFRMPDHAIKLNGQAVPVRKGRMHIPLMPVPDATVQHTKKVLSNIITHKVKRHKQDAQWNQPGLVTPNMEYAATPVQEFPCSTARSLAFPATDVTQTTTAMEEGEVAAGDNPGQSTFRQTELQPLTDVELTRRFHLIETEFQRSDARFNKLEHLCSNVAKTNIDITTQLKDLALAVTNLANAPSSRRTKNARVLLNDDDGGDTDYLLGENDEKCL